MKNIFVIIFLFTFFSSFPLAASGQEETPGAREAQVVAKKAKIYLEANPFSVVIDTVQQGTVVALFPSGKKDKKWLYISYYSLKRDAQVTGFIKADSVEIFQQKPEPQPEQAAETALEANDEEDSVAVEVESVKTENKTEEKEESSEGEKPKDVKSKEQETDKAKTRKAEEVEKQREEKERAEEEKTEQNAEARQTDKANAADEAANLAEHQKTLEGVSEALKEPAAKEKEQTQEGRVSSEEQHPPEKDTERNDNKEEEIAEEAKAQKIDENEDTAQQFIAKGEEQAAKKEDTIHKREKEGTSNLQKERAESDVSRKKEAPPLEAAQNEETKGNRDYAPPQVLDKVSIKVQLANIRLMPSLQSAVIHQVPSGVELKALAKTGNWYRVDLPPNEDGLVLSGYIHHSIVNEIYASVQPVVELEEPEVVPEIKGEDPGATREPEKEIDLLHQTEKSGLSLWMGGGAGYNLPAESRFEKGMSIGGTLGLEIMKYLAIEIRIPYFRIEVVESFEGLSAGQLQNLTFMLSLQARYPLGDQFVPYLVGGGDYHLNKFILNNGIKNSWNDLGFTLEENVDHSFGFHAGAGLDFFLMRNIALNVDVRYFTANLNGTWRIVDQTTQQEISGPIESMRLNSIQAGISVKFFLGR